MFSLLSFYSSLFLFFFFFSLSLFLSFLLFLFLSLSLFSLSLSLFFIFLSIFLSFSLICNFFSIFYLFLLSKRIHPGQINIWNKKTDIFCESSVRPSQGGFRLGRGCVDQIFSLRRTIEQRWAYQKPTVLYIIDIAAAFDSVGRDSLWRIMEANGMPAKLLRLIKGYYRSTRARVRAYGEDETLENRFFSPSSPTLFLLPPHPFSSFLLSSSFPSLFLSPSFSFLSFSRIFFIPSDSTSTPVSLCCRNLWI
ncbi:unnamed protein product [Acanthosepion pharaonis]|uniref:Reverse transcriptase domain-containing protein n=1 Tax=Acanthosepion pharaonis TaxID=158019 RepID=A0A812CWG8_ACAPH|nr:unnamed protein product [Sepia pharaonis]